MMSKRRKTMETPRKIGIFIVTIVPTFVGAGALWDLFESWFAVLVWAVLMAVLAGSVISGKLHLPGES
jgi:hypothetical protein